MFIKEKKFNLKNYARKWAFAMTLFIIAYILWGGMSNVLLWSHHNKKILSGKNAKKRV